MATIITPRNTHPESANSHGAACSRYEKNMTGYSALSVTPDNHLKKPSRKPHRGPNAAVTHATKPEFSGNAVESSAVINASGTDQQRGSTMNPRMVNSAPAEETASSTPNGPPETS